MLTLLLNTELVYCCLSLCVCLEDGLVSDKSVSKAVCVMLNGEKQMIQVAVKNRPEKALKSILVIKMV